MLILVRHPGEGIRIGEEGEELIERRVEPPKCETAAHSPRHC